jgi:NAD dependent epimerase/dehydratase family
VVIHTASGFHTGCAKTLIQGLAERKGRTGREVYYIHTSGTSNLATSPLLNLYPSHPHPSPPSTSTPPFSDLHASDHALVLSTLKFLNSTYPYPQRTTDLTVISTGLSATPTVPTHILMPPVIYGAGTGLYHASTHQIPALIRSAIAEKQAWMIGDGSGIKAHVHITDLAEFYCLLVARLLEGVEVLRGEEGVLFVENGEHSWLDVAQGVAKAGHELGRLPTEEVKSISLQEAMHKLDWGTEVWTESGFAASSRISADFGREKLGWKCRFPPEDFNEHFVGEWKKVLESGEGDGFRIGIEGK